MRERRTQCQLIRSGLATGILVAALFFQMLPFFLLMVVMAYAMGVTGGAMLVIVPVLLFAMIFAACGLVSKLKQRVPYWPPPGPVAEDKGRALPGPEGSFGARLALGDLSLKMVPPGRIELPLPCENGILNPARLPIPPQGLNKPATS